MASYIMFYLYDSKYFAIFCLLCFQILPIYTDVSQTTSQNDHELCKNGEILTGYALKGGRNAGDYYKIGETSNVEECIDLCCQSEPKDCHLAIFIKNSCYSVECAKAESCKPVKTSKQSSIKPSIFRRYGATFNHKRDPSLILPNVLGSNVTLKREKRFGFCQHYSGATCKNYLDKDRLVYYEEKPDVVEHRLTGPLTVIQGHFKPRCKEYALPALCLTSFPYCESKPHPQAIRLCQEDCKQLYEDENLCKHDFNLAKKVANKYPPLLKIMPNCSSLVSPSEEGDDCVKLGFNKDDESLSTTLSSSEKPELTTSTTPTIVSTEDTKKTTLHPYSKLGTKTPQPPTLLAHKTESKITERTPTRPSKTELKTSQDTLIASTFKPNTAHKILEIKTPDIQTTTQPENKLPTDNTTLKNDSELTKDQDNDEEPRTIDIQTEKIEHRTEETTHQSPTDIVDHPKENIAPTEASPIHIGKHKFDNDEWSKLNEKTDTSELGQKDTSTSESRTDVSSNDTSSTKDHLSTINTTISPNKTTTKSLLLSSVFATPQNVEKSSVGKEESTERSPDDTVAPPTVVNINETNDGLDLEAVNKENKASIIHLQVSTVGDTEIILPKDTASLYASAWPKESEIYPYSYQWIQLASPKDGNGYMEGKNSQRVVLSKLTKPGVYQFQVIVRNEKHAYGTAYVNVTVKERQHVNKPPRADISPKEQSITLPTNEVALDGSKSSDDDKIVEYKWQELKGPLTEKDKTIKSGLNSPLLQLKSLLPGVYTYKLTVTDSDGETDSTFATVTVNAEKDYPPVARAENNVVITLPVNYVTLYGNGSTDDHGIKSYEWIKDPLSPTCDLQGTAESILHVSNMVVGDYTFTLKVTDTGDQSSESKVTVFVQPEKNAAPVAKAGDDKDLVHPDDSTTLNAKDSHDDQGISRYHWEQVSGPSSVKMSGVDNMILSLSHLTEGHYLFKLTVYDSKGLTGTDTVSVNVKKDGNQPPIANAGPDVMVKLPNRAAALDGSKSSDDYGIVKYSWARDMKSPAAGDIINSSDEQAILRLSNLVKGVYIFRLTVTDAKGVEATDDAKIVVKEDENSPSLVELYLDVDVTSFSEANKRQLVRKLAVSLNVMDTDIVIEHIQPSGRGNNLVVLFYVKDSLTSQIRDGKEIADLLKQKLRDNFFEFKMEEVNPYVCRNNCSGHGHCDQHTKQCVCESFWMQDPFKANFGLRERNCDWSILYVVVIIFGVVVAIVGITWGMCFCLGRTKIRRRKNQYSIIGDEDSEDDVKNTTMELYPRGKFVNSSIMSETDMDTDEETLFENEKPYKGSRTKLNGMINGHKTPHT